MSINRLSRANNPDSNSGAVLLHGSFIGFVKNNDDIQKMGRLSVYIPEIGGDPTNPQDWIIVGYASMFGGATSVYGLKKGDQTMAGSQTSYGWWGVPPDLDNEVLITFVNGDIARGYWYACVFQQNMNQMVPGIAASTTDDPSYKSQGAVPSVEYNKIGEQKPDNPSRPVFTPLADAIKTQGLQADPQRGYATSSARRGGVSQVYGFNTPRAHQIYVDDNKDNEFIRIRTRSGTQILVNETSGFVYINSKSGNSWMEISDSGIDVYSKNSVSLRAEQDFNVRADNNIIFDAGGTIFLRSQNDLNIQTGGKIVLGADGNLELSTSGKATLTTTGDFLSSVGGALRSQSTGDTSVNAGGSHITSASGSITRQAPSIQDNPGGATAPTVQPAPAEVPTPTSAPDIDSSSNAPTTSKTIVNRLVTHEPFAGHPSTKSSSSSSASSLAGSSAISVAASLLSSYGASSPLTGITAIGTALGTISSAALFAGSLTNGTTLTANAASVVAQYAGQSVGTGQCVALVKAATGLGPSSTWKQGDPVTADNIASIPAGTPIATFQNGAYQNATNGNSHAAILLGPGTTASGQPGIQVLDQWSGSAASVRVLPFNAYNKAPCNNGSAFSVVQS
jgi:hypothetical protein